MPRNALPAALDAFQNQCFSGERYVGFQCPFKFPRCKIRQIEQGNNTNLLVAFQKAAPFMEKAHRPGREFRLYGTTNAEDIIVMCGDCHTLMDGDEGGNTRLPRK